jgi:hypothetical protein
VGRHKVAEFFAYGVLRRHLLLLCYFEMVEGRRKRLEDEQRQAEREIKELAAKCALQGMLPDSHA